MLCVLVVQDVLDWMFEVYVVNEIMCYLHWWDYMILALRNELWCWLTSMYGRNCASIIDGIELRWWLYDVVMYCKRVIIKWKFDCALLYLLIKFDEYWDKSNPRAENSAREKEIVAENSANVAEVSAREKEIVADISANFGGCEFDKQTW